MSDYTEEQKNKIPHTFEEWKEIMLSEDWEYGGDVYNNAMLAADGDFELGYKLFCLVKISIDGSGEGLLIDYINKRGCHDSISFEKTIHLLQLKSCKKTWALREERRALHPKKRRRKYSIIINAMGRRIK